METKLVVTKVANGFMVTPLIHQHMAFSEQDAYVFETFIAMSMWLEDSFKPKEKNEQDN